MSTSPVNAVTFDLWRTLIKANGKFRGLRNQSIQDIWGTSFDEAVFTKYVADASDEADELMLSQGNDLGYEYRVLRALEMGGIDTNVSNRDELIAEGLRVQSEIAWTHVPQLMEPNVVRSIATLAERYPLAIISNTGMLPGTLMRELLTDLDLLEHFSVHSFSNEVETAKPFAGIFQHAFDGLLKIVPNLEKANVLHIGDNKVADVVGAEKFSFQAQLVNVGDAPSIEKVINDLIWEN